MKRAETRARAGMISAMAVFGSIGLFVRMIALSSAEIALYRALLALLLLGAVLLFRRRKSETFPASPTTKRRRLLLLLSGAAMGFNWIFLFEAYRYTTVTTATLCYYAAPILVTVLSPLLFGERITVRQIVCFGISTVGVLLLTGVSAVTRQELTGVVFGLCAACLYAAVILINRGLGDGDPMVRTALQFGAAAIVLLPYVLLSGDIRLPEITATGVLCLLCVGLVHTGITYCVYFASLQKLPGQEAAILSYIDPLTAVLLSVFVLGETMTPAQIIGGVLILGASIANEIMST